MNTVGESVMYIVDIGQESYKVGYANNELPSRYNRRNKRKEEEILSETIDQKTEDTSSIPLVYIEDPFTGTENRKRIFSYLMESSLCSGVLFINGAISDCFSYGKSTGLMIRLGGGSTQVIPVIDGYCLSGGIRSSCGGESLTRHTRNLLETKGKKLDKELLLPPVAIQERKRVSLEQAPEYKVKESYYSIAPETRLDQELEVARCFKETVSFIGHCQPSYYEFSTGFTTRIFSERNEIPERLFSPDTCHIDRLDPFKQLTGTIGPMGLLEMIKTVIDSVDIEYCDMLLGNIMISGGGSFIPGITERLQTDIMKMYPNNRVKVNNDRREFSTFFGGSILGSLTAANTLMITQEEYSELGMSVLERKRTEWIK
ncbi:actin-like protein 6B [Nematocida sp. AWRm80]|nr:actin-like protein 6B [Nematocida sp. AWRm80]